MDIDHQRMQVNRKELVERIARTIRKDGVTQPLPGLHLARLSTPSQRVHGVLDPSLCVIAQGSKMTYVGDTHYQYDPFNYLLATLGLPRVSQVLEASHERPYLSLRLELDPDLVGSVMVETGYSMPPGQIDVRALNVHMLEADLLDAVVRLMRLVDMPGEAGVLLSLIKREIIYRLLMSEQGARLCHLTVAGNHNTPSIARAVELLRQNLAQPVRVEALAQELGMSVSSFHHHFKAVTELSPLQYQKRLRLQEARRLMLGEDLDAASAAYRVGYSDASHFSREYKSLFGAPPIRDIQRLRADAG